MNALGEGGLFKEENAISITKNQFAITFFPLKAIIKSLTSYTYTYTSKTKKRCMASMEPILHERKNNSSS